MSLTSNIRSNIYGLIVCGGNSTRMGKDKSLLTYHGKQQRYHMYDILQSLCEKTFLSCNRLQQDSVNHEYQTLVDLKRYESIGPMAALLTAFERFPERDFLVAGCDYPFLTTRDLIDFFRVFKKKDVAAAFYNPDEELYEPLLAWYSHQSADGLKEMFKQKQYSLQYFLRSVNAKRYFPENTIAITSVDTPESMMAAKAKLGKMELLKT